MLLCKSKSKPGDFKKQHYDSFNWSFEVVSSLTKRICLEWTAAGSTGVSPMSNCWVTIQWGGRWIIKCVCVSSFFLCDSVINDICIYVALTVSVCVLAHTLCIWSVLIILTSSLLKMSGPNCSHCSLSFHAFTHTIIHHTYTHIHRQTDAETQTKNKAWNSDIFLLCNCPPTFFPSIQKPSTARAKMNKWVAPRSGGWCAVKALLRSRAHWCHCVRPQYATQKMFLLSSHSSPILSPLIVVSDVT